MKRRNIFGMMFACAPRSPVAPSESVWSEPGTETYTATSRLSCSRRLMT